MDSSASPIDISKTWFRLIRTVQIDSFRHTKIFKAYTDFLWAWLSLIFFIKHYAGSEKVNIKNLSKSLSDTQLKSILTTPVMDQIHELSKLKIANMDPRDGHDPMEENNALETALKSSNERDIFRSTMLLLYVVRCNLFHGDKSWTVSRDNQIVYHSQKLLVSILDKLLV
ncbi:hypothetical protein KKG55_00410 [Candidatus Micrarchaeota archaeon]|nr:hypothetical protein [Candidatus Micrarchaeota archaeon]MBU1886166.1 hypothetical protein [Candidatus Micrarchaeota archaeon]